MGPKRFKEKPNLLISVLGWQLSVIRRWNPLGLSPQGQCQAPHRATELESLV